MITTASFLKKYWLITLLTFCGALLRFYKLSTFPPSLNWDEVSHGYNAYSLLKTGLDEWGVRFPLIFRAFGDYKLPVYIYATTLPIWLFGLNAFAVRFISALAGTLAVPGIYFLVNQLFGHHRESRPARSAFSTADAGGSAEAISESGIASSITPRNDSLALIAAFLLTFSPWHFFISRPALEANLSLTLTIFGFYFFLKYLQQESSLLPSALLLGLSLHTYNTARVFVPLLLITTLFIFRSNLKSIIATGQSSLKNIFAIIFFATSIAIVGTQIFSGEATARYKKLQILTENTVYQIGERRSASHLPFFLPRLVYNRPVYLAQTVASNYAKYFSPQFFFQSVGSQTQFAIPGQNMITLPVLFLALWGIFLVFLNLDSKSNQFLLVWLLVSPLAASLTADPPQALRPNPLIPAVVILSSLGLVKVSQYFKNQKLIPLTLALVFVSFTAYIYQYFYIYPLAHSQSWQYGYSTVMDFVRFYQKDYTNVFITKRLGEPHIFYAFYGRLNPTKIQPGANTIRFQKSDWFWTDKIDNVYFLNDWTIPTGLASKFWLESGQGISSNNSLLITSPDHVPSNAKVIETINNLDGTPALIITSIR